MRIERSHENVRADGLRNYIWKQGCGLHSFNLILVKCVNCRLAYACSLRLSSPSARITQLAAKQHGK